MPKALKVPHNAKDLPQEIVKQMLTLATSGLGLVAALAWNELIKETIETYVKPYLPQGSTVVSLFIYAMIVTILAVVVTLQLTKLQNKIKSKEDSSL